MFRPFLTKVCAEWSTHPEPSTIDLENMKRPRRYQMVDEGYLPSGEDHVGTTSDITIFEPRRPQPSFFYHGNTHIDSPDLEHLGDGGRAEIHVVRGWRVES